MIDNILNVSTRLPIGVSKTTTSQHVGLATPPLLSFKTPLLNQKATLRVKKIKRSDNIVIVGEVDDDYVDIIEEELEEEQNKNPFSFSSSPKPKRKYSILKHCYVIDYIQSPQMRNGLGTQAIKQLAEKAMFDSRAEGRIVTFSSPVWKESSPAIFFYKLGFRFMDVKANQYIENCIIQRVPDAPPQTGMMYLPKRNLNKLLRYGDCA